MSGSHRLRSTVPALSLIAVATLGLAACGGSMGYGGAAAPAASPTGSATGAGIHLASTADGSVLVDDNGHTLYMLTADKAGMSSCSGSCAAAWPVVPATTKHAATVTATLGSLTRADGTTQLTVDGMPAYTYVADSTPGAVNGQGVNSYGGTWWLLSPAGKAITSSSSPGSSTSPSGYVPGRY